MLKQILDPFLTILGGMFGGLWERPVFFMFVILAVVLLGLSRLPGVKGWIGETIMRVSFSLFLPKDVYRVIHNVTIPDGQGGTTQIDHVIVSAFGVFVVETKHHRGWVFGGEKDRTWTQKIHGGHSQKFQNPLRQNYKHTECLQELLGLESSEVKSVVVFTGNCTLKTKEKLPDHVTKPGSCVRYIKSQADTILDEAAVCALENTIREERLKPSWKTSREHVAYVKGLHGEEPAAVPEPHPGPAEPSPADPAPEPVCPKCGAAMALRTAKRGANAGNQFWGCTNYPKCRQILNVAETA